MPGAPNRPPEIAAPATPPPSPDPPERKLLRRIVPSHVALLQDSWKGTAPPEVVAPFEKADAALRAGDLPGATSALDLLSIRFAEPRWPSLPEPFRRLRVAIPAPVPPHWDPDHGLAAPEREARHARRVAEEQLALADASVAWASAHAVPAEDLGPELASARAALTTPGVPPEFYASIDRVWETLRSRLPALRAAARAPAAPAADG